MTKRESLDIICGISIVGILFSGYLSYRELFLQNCGLGCGGGGINLGMPACVYGLIMYSIVFVVSLMGIKAKK